MNSPSFPIDKGKFFLQLGDDLHSFLGIKKLGSRANLHTIAECLILSIRNLGYRITETAQWLKLPIFD